MKLLTRNTDYAIRAVCYIAGNKKELISAKELVGALKIPRPFLRKILQRLNKSGIVRSYKGLGGGFKLALPVNKIFLTDIIEAFQGPFVLNECSFRKALCPNKKICPLKKRIDKIEGYVTAQLKSITISELLKG